MSNYLKYAKIICMNNKTEKINLKKSSDKSIVSKHPKYYKDAKFVCACGANFTAGSTEPEVRVEICSDCHPYYTGKSKLVDTAGRVDRFKNLLEKKRAIQEKSVTKKATKKEK